MGAGARPGTYWCWFVGFRRWPVVQSGLVCIICMGACSPIDLHFIAGVVAVGLCTLDGRVWDCVLVHNFLCR